MIVCCDVSLENFVNQRNLPNCQLAILYVCICIGYDYWVSCVQKLGVMAKIHPHVAYCAYTHGLVAKWTNFLRTLPDVSDLLCSLELTIVKEFIPAVTSRCVSDLERGLLALPVWMGGL